VPYYTAVIARVADEWELVPADLEDLEDLDDIADAVRDSVPTGPGLAVLEREDEWFAVVRVDGDAEPRVFVSDLAAAREGVHAGIFQDVRDADGGRAAVATVTDEDEVDDDPDDEADSGSVTESPSARSLVSAPWGGDPAILDDLGVSGDVLTELVDKSPDPATALLEVARAGGFDELVEAWH
jgi:putative tRNA adenosine deaminase-associated protein